jgi:porphobilinogen deaminase
LILTSLVFYQEGGCSAPVAAHAEIQDDNLSILAGVWSLDGKQKILDTHQVNFSQNLLFWVD